MKKAIIIGAGKSFFDTNMVERLATNPNVDHIILSDRIADEALRRGLDPVRSYISVVTHEYLTTNAHLIMQYYQRMYMMKYKINLNVYIANVASVKMIKDISSIFEKTFTFDRFGKVQQNKDPFATSIDSCHNVGMACFGVAWKILGCDQIGLIGIDFEPYRLDNGGTDWSHELDLSLKEIRKRIESKDVSVFNLSGTSRLKDPHIMECSLEDFLRDSYSDNRVYKDHGQIDHYLY